MSLIIDFIDETKKVRDGHQNLVEDILQFVATRENIDDGAELSITFVSNKRIQEINREYRNKDQPTDVISFAMEEMGEDEIEITGIELPVVLGDIIISTTKAKEQAEEYGHSFERELAFLSVHGLLHLLGYDHETEEEEVIMFTKQKEILEQYGLSR
ncbi:rRNA maturation RNase YbeY [Cytobacillus sp. IB215665]|uniref:rRNA maturation RNase YbeY n=1 Tax=Cytobacillus sp. IB215665 TaxID=3097357 RepID=UPI002A16FA0C|nr:rRNA maturation RNase YbeY [Cytobacillus sp. IB215665]MDX8364191.1 rRNA maturation RNase YbeY [Cytobacillus sp. IB215665]